MFDDPMIGRELGNYVVESKLGEGGMGAVYRLVHRSLPNTYAALKVLNARGAAAASAKERFEQEAKVAAALGSDRVVKPIDIGAFSDGSPYIMMEYVAGQALADLLDQTGPMRVLPALEVAYAVADSLVSAHSQGIVHRDIKPSNIMLVRSREHEFKVKILDWGIARARGALQVAQTASSVVAGTLGYMSLEVVCGGEDIDGRADVFSLGVTLYKTLTGVLPFPALTSADQAPAFQAARPLPIAQNRPASLDTVPRWLERLIFKSLTPLRERRPTMDQFREELSKALAAVRLSPDNIPSQPPPGLRLDSDTPGPSAIFSKPNTESTILLSTATAEFGKTTAAGLRAASLRTLRRRLVGLLLMGIVAMLVLRWLFSSPTERLPHASQNPTPSDFGLRTLPDMVAPPSRPPDMAMGAPLANPVPIRGPKPKPSGVTKSRRGSSLYPAH
jgi:serine/threonine-protein kinase